MRFKRGSIPVSRHPYDARLCAVSRVRSLRTIIILGYHLASHARRFPCAGSLSAQVAPWHTLASVGTKPFTCQRTRHSRGDSRRKLANIPGFASDNPLPAPQSYQTHLHGRGSGGRGGTYGGGYPFANFLPLSRFLHKPSKKFNLCVKHLRESQKTYRRNRQL